MKIGIIVGSVRDSRNGTSVAQWVAKAAASQPDAEFEVIELRDFNLPILTDPIVPGAANREYGTEEARTWGRKIDEFDGFVFVTPEYNHGVPGAFKNAFDSIAPEWMYKSVGIVSYGADGGVRAVEQWRQIVANMHMVAVRHQVSLSLFTEFDSNGVAPDERRDGELAELLSEVVTMARILAPRREPVVPA